jgi:hypothetical protein
MMTCGARWYGPRADVPDAFANHICGREGTHAIHECVCGSYQLTHQGVDSMTFAQFQDKVRYPYPYERSGQHAYNLLMHTRPDLCGALVGSELDPFYDDDRLPAFLEWVSEHWGDE